MGDNSMDNTALQANLDVGNDSIDDIGDDEALPDTDLLREIVMSLVDKTDVVSVVAEDNGIFRNLFVYVDQDEVGKVIGKGGDLHLAMRALFNAAAAKTGRKVTITVDYPGSNHNPGPRSKKTRFDHRDSSNFQDSRNYGGNDRPYDKGRPRIVHRNQPSTGPEVFRRRTP